jgi:hypothetical protein
LSERLIVGLEEGAQLTGYRGLSARSLIQLTELFDDLLAVCSNAREPERVAVRDDEQT